MQALLAIKAGEVPVGCVFVRDNKIIASGHNETVIFSNVNANTNHS